MTQRVEDSEIGPVPEDENLMDHEYDGIREYDNPLPRWWTLIFWGTFLFAIGYLFHYHVSGNGESVNQQYVAEMRVAGEQEAQRAAAEKPTEEALAKLASNSAVVDDAHALFTERCAVCHADKGQGQIGPNLTDGYWIHGKGTLMDIYGVVSDGVPAKGMPAWSKQLTPVELRKIVAYVGSIRNSNVPGKPPEGTPVSAK